MKLVVVVYEFLDGDTAQIEFMLADMDAIFYSVCPIARENNTRKEQKKRKNQIGIVSYSAWLLK